MRRVSPVRLSRIPSAAARDDLVAGCRVQASPERCAKPLSPGGHIALQGCRNFRVLA